MRISVALCTYNGEKYIAQQLQSILSQTHPVDEIVISDDGSTDNTLSIAEKILQGGSIAYKIQQNTLAEGVAHNFLSAITSTTGEYVFTCDQDDVWLPHKVACFLEWAQRHPADLYFSDGELVDKDCQSMGVGLWQSYGLDYDSLSARELMYTLIRHPVVTGAAMMVSRRLVNRVSSIPDGWLHDEWFSIIAGLGDSAVPLPEKTFYYRQHGKNVVGAKKLTLLNKVSLWIKGFENLHTQHELRLKKCTDIACAAQGTKYETLATNAVLFWKDLVALPDQGRVCGLRKITGHLCNGSYRAYWSSYRSYVRDVLTVLFILKRPTKK